MKNFKVKFSKIKESCYHFDIVSPYIRYKYMTDVLYDRMIEFGFWWWRLEIYYQGSVCGWFFAQLFDAIDFLVHLLYYLTIDYTKYYFKKFINLFKRKNQNKQH